MLWKNRLLLSRGQSTTLQKVSLELFWLCSDGRKCFDWFSDLCGCILSEIEEEYEEEEEEEEHMSAAQLMGHAHAPGKHRNTVCFPPKVAVNALVFF